MMTDARRILLEKYLRGVAPAASATAPLRSMIRRNANGVSLSFAQERLWFLDQLLPGSAVFNVPLAVRLPNRVDEEILEQSINEIIRRHEVLRTTFATNNGSPVPKVVAHLKIKLRVADLSHLDAVAAEAKASELTKEEAETPFDLSNGPLIRAFLVRLNQDEQIFVITFHHICSDGWSLVLFFDELAAIYEAYVSGFQSPLADVQVQYADYAAWQKEWLSGDVLNKQLAYWKEQLGGELPILDLPTDRPRPAVQTYAGSCVTLSLSKDITAALNLLSQREGVSLFMTLLAAFKVLLYRHTGQSDIVVGSPIANRPHADTQKMIGFFLNNLALRTELSGDPTFNDLLKRVRTTSLDAYANQDVPFEKLIEELKPERDLSRTTIFQVYFNLFNFSEGVKLPGGEGQTISFFKAWSQSDESLSKFDLTLYAGIDQDRLQLAFVYNTDLFDASSMEKMLRHYQVLLTEIIANPGVSISSCPLVVPEEKKHPLISPVTDFVEFEKAEIEQTIPQRFAAQVKQHPNKLAIKTTTCRWTYDELSQAANRVAHTILEQTGAKESDTVALLFDHDAPMVAAMIGALKAGKAYVPLDPASPAERLAQIINDAEAGVLITNNLNQKFAASLTVKGLRVINIDKLRRARTDNVEVSADPGALAYLLYTSGSTGQPKGVMQNHRNVLHFIRAYTNNLKLTANDRLSLFSSYCFDASVMDIYGALLNGAALYPVDIKKQGFDGAVKCLLDEAITVYHSTPTVYRHFVKSIATEKFSSVRLVVLGGEPVNRTDVALFKKHFPDHAVMINGLGPTEATVSIQYFIDKTTAISGQSVPVGAPVADTEVLLLDEGTEAKGIAGEIALRCDHVALGYWRNDKATTAAFLTDENGARIYRTGDLGRRLPDGSILFTGRKDSQVKIRGFRVELGEIETALGRHRSVKESVVVLRSLSSGEKALVAYLVPAAKQSVQQSELRNYLSTSLPEYMVPAVFVTLDSLPLTASGKVNRRALPEPTLPESQTRQARPLTSRSAVETALAAVWAEVLGLKVVGFNDNFFELGGHSLLAVVLFARIAKYFGKRLPLATLFRAPTVTQLAAVIEDSSTLGWSSLVPIQPSGSRPPFFCMHAKGGNVLEYNDLARHLGSDQPFYGLQSQGLNSQIEPHTRISDMAAHYIGQIKEVQASGPYFLGGRSMGGTIAYEMACQLLAAGEEVALLALLDTYPSGYLHNLPSENTLGPKVRRLQKRIRCHSENMSGLPLREQFRYLMEKACFAPTRVKTLLWRKTNRVFRKLDCPLPSALCNVNEFNSLAAAEYAPQPYPGEVTLFWASADRRASFDLVDGWRVLAEGGIDIHEISGSHLNLIKEPYVTELAQKLGRCLRAAQEKVSASTAPDIPDVVGARTHAIMKMAS